MGLRARTIAAVDKAWNAAGDFPISATLRRRTGTTTDPFTGDVTPIYTDIAVSVIESTYTTFERSLSGIEIDDVRYLLRSNQLNGAKINTAGDILQIGAQAFDIVNAVPYNDIVIEIQARAAV